METVFIVCDSQKPVSLSNLRASFSGVVQTGRIQEEIPRTQRLSPQQVLGESSLDVFFFFCSLDVLRSGVLRTLESLWRGANLNDFTALLENAVILKA